MLGSNKPTRIGDILMERGIISRPQLLQALDLQQARHLLSDRDAPQQSRNEIGEILIELGFITREQLKKNLAHQHRLRKTTLAFTLVAPLFTMACGGGGANASTPQSGTNSNVSSVVVVQSSKSPDATQSSAASVSSTPPQSPSSESTSSSVPDGPASSAISSSSSAISSGQNSSVKSSASSKTSSSVTSAPIEGPVVLYWTVPTRRESGEALDVNDISGYQVRYKLRNKRDFTYINIPSGFTDTYYFDYLKGDYEFQIAAVDVDGLYSRFVTINPVK